MKRIYSKPGIEIKTFNKEQLLTASSGAAKPLSAEDKAKEALNAAGAKRISTVVW